METENVQLPDSEVSGGSSTSQLLPSARILIPAIVCLVALVSVPAAFFIGALNGNTQVYNNLSEHQQQRIEEFFAQHPDSFRHLSVEHASNGWAYPIGTVSNQSDYDLLAANLHRMFGDELAEQMLVAVAVESEVLETDDNG